MNRSADERSEVDLPLIDRETADPCFHRYCFGDFFAGVKPVWIKIIVGAIAMPIVLIFRVVSTDRASASRFLSGPAATAGLLATGALVGAVLGGSLAMKEIINARLAAGRSVSWPFRLAFCCGNVSLLLVWGPIGIGMLIVVSILFL